MEKPRRSLRIIAQEKKHKNDCVCGEPTPSRQFATGVCHKRLSNVQEILQDSFVECECGHRFHEACAVVAMIKTRFSHIIKAVNKMDFEKDGSLSRENIFKLCMAWCRRGELWCAMCCEDVKIKSNRLEFLNQVIDSEDMSDEELNVYGRYLGRSLELVKAWFMID